MLEVCVQCVDDLSRCEGSLADIFLMQQVSVTVTCSNTLIFQLQARFGAAVTFIISRLFPNG